MAKKKGDHPVAFFSWAHSRADMQPSHAQRFTVAPKDAGQSSVNLAKDWPDF